MSVTRTSIVVALGVLFLFRIAPAQLRYSEVRIPLKSRSDLRQLSALGIAADHGLDRAGRWIDLFVTQDELRTLRDHAVPYSILIDDWKTYYRARQAQESRAGAPLLSISPPRHFHLGSLGGFLTFKEVAAELDAMRLAYPALISVKDSVGRTDESRPIWCVKISRNPEVDRALPRVLYTGLHHAREPEGMMQLMYFMWYLLENYGTDAEVTALLDHRELYFVPVVNPDGYTYNESTDSLGGGLWRKNRHVNADSSIGVDLNRNYGYQWGVDNYGSSSRGPDDTYRGAAPFSELETQAIRNLCVEKQFTAALNYHSFGNVLIYPWGYSDVETKDSLIFRGLADDLTSSSHYVAGTGGQTVGYTTNGDADDWMFGDTLQKKVVYAMTAEVGDEFWPPSSRILPIAEENLKANLMLAHAAGQSVLVRDVSVDQRNGNDTIRLALTLTDRGLAVSPSTLTIGFKSAGLTVLAAPTGSFAWESNAPFVFDAVRNPLIQSGDRVKIDMGISYEGGFSADSIVFRAGVPLTLFADDAESGRGNWISQTSRPEMEWDTTSIHAHSGLHSFSESPRGNYLDNLSSSFTLGKPFVLSGAAAEFRFWTMWDVERNYDYARVEISVDGGSGWIPLSGKYTSPGSGLSDAKQPPGAPCYNGVQRGWVEEVIDLTPYLGQNIWIRFAFDSDQFVNRDGFSIDDIRLLLYPQTLSGVAHDGQPHQFILRQNWPNPFNPSTLINYDLPATSQVQLAVFDVLGRTVETLVDAVQSAGSHAIMFTGKGISSGIYFYRLTACPPGSDGRGAFVDVKKMILLR